MILELRRYWAYHPKYRDIVEHIQGKYSFRERPQYGIVLKNSSANQVQLSADNFQGTVVSYIHLAKVENYPGLAIEWVREDGRAILDNGGIFPSSAGIYYIDITEDNEFYIDPLLDVKNESVTMIDASNWQLQHPFVEGTLAIYEMPGNLPLYATTNYTADSGTGEITLVNPLPDNTFLSADYRYPGTSTGPWGIRENFAHNKAIPGCILAFGRRVEKGDRLAVVVRDHRAPTALEYGGRWEISIDFDVISRDHDAQMEITDQTVSYLWGVARNRLSTEGIEILNVSMGGESEEIADENADLYFYNASFSVTVQTDWAIHVPLSACIRRAIPQTKEQAQAAAGMTDDQIAALEGSDTTVTMLQQLGLREFDDPFFVGKSKTFEMIR